MCTSRIIKKKSRTHCENISECQRQKKKKKKIFKVTGENTGNLGKIDEMAEFPDLTMGMMETRKHQC